MGKDLKGKELGVGISQRKDGLYTARFTDKRGKRHQKYFKKLQECRNWIADMQFQVEHSDISSMGEMTVNAWFEYWITEIKRNNIKESTIENYFNFYKNNIKMYIGNMLLKDVKPLHCQEVLNKMAENYTISTIGQARLTMYTIFESAVENELILKNPVTKAVKCTKGKPSKEKRVLTLEEQKTFLETAKKSTYYNQYAFLLQTGLRTGEMTGLKWSDIDFENRIISVKRTMGYKYKNKEWQTGEPKTKNSCRKIPLTQEAINILKDQKRKNQSLKIIKLEFSEYVFLNTMGKPVATSNYDDSLENLAKKSAIKKLSMHTLRHTFATRCIEAGMKPKTLQMILGHSNIGTTMNLYVHTTEEEKKKEIESIEKMLKII